MADRPAVALDTSVVVAGLGTWHEHHPQAYGLLARLLGGSEAPRVVVPRQVVTEAYSVLTRLPAPRRMSPEAVLRSLSETFRDCVEVVDRPEGDVWSFLLAARQRGIAGGSIHDAAILDVAEGAGASRLYTFNLRHFERLGSRRVEIVSP